MTEIGNAYGGALFALCAEEGLDGEILEQMDAVCAIMKDNPDYTRLMSSPNLSKDQRLELLRESFEGKSHEYLLNFMCILAENGTFEELGSSYEAYRNLYNQSHNIIEVTAATAVEMDEAQRLALKAKLEKETGKTVVLTNVTDPSCIGGVRLEMNGRRIDGSVRSRLEAIRDSLLKAKA